MTEELREGTDVAEVATDMVLLTWEAIRLHSAEMANN